MMNYEGTGKRRISGIYGTVSIWLRCRVFFTRNMKMNRSIERLVGFGESSLLGNELQYPRWGMLHAAAEGFFLANITKSL